MILLGCKFNRHCELRRSNPRSGIATVGMASLAMTHNNMYEQSLQQAGLTPDQALIYEVLLKNGPLKASKVHQKTPLKRGWVYKILEDLAKMGLVEKKEEPGKVAIFSPAHPLKLRDLAETKERQAKDAQVALAGILPDITSVYNLIIGKPGVRFFEGLEGVKKVLDDALINNTQKSILSLSDAAGYATYLKDWNTEYFAPKRKKLGIFEKVIIPNHPKAIEWLSGYQSKEVTEFLFIDHNLYPFKTEVSIYEKKVSFVTFSERAHIGVIIENGEIHETMKTFFNFMWNFAKQYNQDLQPGWVAPRKNDDGENASKYV